MARKEKPIEEEAKRIDAFPAWCQSLQWMKHTTRHTISRRRTPLTKMRKPRADMSERYVSFFVSFTKSINRLRVRKTFGLRLCVVLDYVHARSSGRCAFPLALSVTASRVGLLHSFRFKSISAWWQLGGNPFAVFACVAILGLHQACFVARLLSAQIRSTMLAVFSLSSIKR